MNKLFLLLKKQYLIIIALLILFIALLLEYQYNISSSYLINKKHIEKILHRKENKTIELSKNVIDILSKNKSIFQVYNIFRNNFNQLSNKGIYFLIFENDTLVYWSNNSLPVRNILTYTNFNKPVIKLPNGWYVCKKFKTYNFTVIGLILIKYEYVYQNDYLINDFQKEFGIPSYKNIIISENENGIPIYNINGQLLFRIYVTDNTSKIQEYASFSIVFYFLFILIFGLYINNLLKYIKNTVKRNASVIIIGFILLIIRFLLLKFHIPKIFNHSELFNPVHYASSTLIPSLGDLMIHSIFLNIFSIIFYSNFTFGNKIKTNKVIAELSLLIASAIITILFYLITEIISSLIFDSTLTFKLSDLLSISTLSILGFFTIALIILSFVVISDKILKNIILSDYQNYIFKITAYILVYTTLIWFFNYKITFYHVIFLLIFLYLIGYIRYIKKNYSFSSLLLIALVVSIFTISLIEIKLYEKTAHEAKVLVVNLANERDPIAEYMFEDISESIRKDEYISNYLKSEIKDISLLEDYIFKIYFSGYFRKYLMQVTVCKPDEDLLIENTNELVHCHQFFDSLITKNGYQIPNTNFYFLQSPTGRISYLGVFTLKFDKYQLNTYISLDSKIFDDQLGYPELLLQGKREKPAHLSKYSYAKYYNNKLIAQSGEYMYNISCPKAFKNTHYEVSTVRMNNYVHNIYKASEFYTVVLSYPKIKIINVIVQFTYIFLFYIIFTLIIAVIIKYPEVIENLKYDFKNRIRFSVIGILLLSFLFTGAATILLSIKRFENKQQEILNEKMQSIMVELERKVGYENCLDISWRNYLTNQLRKLSNVFYTDIHLFGNEGELIASSRPEIFENGLTGTRMHTAAYHELIINQAPRYIHKESIGKLKYISAYVPLKNINNQLLAYVNLPYFTKQNVLKDEINTLVIAIVNIYILLILITFFITIFMTNMITRPLKLIQEKIKEIDIGKPIEPIDYQSHDEIGSLIKEYNRMVIELKENIDKLAQSERETAWREMAKQIAHEINNPLTPMKLSVQHLLRSWKDKTPKWDEYFEKTTQTLIEQIDNLSHIATEFSNFATLPKANNENIDIIEILNNSVKLFDNYENISFDKKIATTKPIYIFADKVHISRIFNNLIKNSIQAIPTDRKGIIKISLKINSDNLVICISDNGIGIPDNLKDKLFQPNFTTKSSGMGMGLAITKNIITQTGGKIWFESKENLGTSFYIQFPLSNMDYV
jgi:signal transduction histidine kinase